MGVPGCCHRSSRRTVVDVVKMVEYKLRSILDDIITTG
jgi:hypothetical protein